MFCRYCGKEIEQSDLFCEHCGTRLDSLTPELPADNSAPPMQTAPMASAVKTAKPLKKKSILILLGISIAVLLAVIIGPKDRAETPPIASPVEDFEYVLQDGVAIITGYIGTDLDIVIPSVIEDRPVVQINDSAFKDYDLKSVYIPDSVLYICEDAFYNCKQLTTVRMSEDLESIEGAFSYCSSLTSISLPGSLETISYYCFAGCTSLESVTLSEGLTTIESRAFEGCSALTSVKLPKSITRIEEKAFFECTSLTNITIPKNVTLIGALAFGNCTSLKKVTIQSQNVLFDQYTNSYNGTKLSASPFDDGITLVVSKGSSTDYRIQNNLYRYDGWNYNSNPPIQRYTKLSFTIEYI